MKRIITSLWAIALAAGLSLGLIGGLASQASASAVPVVYTGTAIPWTIPHVRPGTCAAFTGPHGPECQGHCRASGPDHDGKAA